MLQLIPLLQLLLLILITIVYQGCSTAQPKMDLTKNYKMDIQIKDGNLCFDGMAVLPKKNNYKIELDADAKLDVFIFKSCSREIVIENARRGLDKKEVVISYQPNDIEKESACSIDLNALNKDRKNAFGWIDFESDETTLISAVLCGEKINFFNGVSICQNREGLQQKIKFNEEVVVKSKCNIKSESGNREGKEFKIDLQVGFCVYVFATKNVPVKFHRLTTYGYNDIILKDQ